MLIQGPSVPGGTGGGGTEPSNRVPCPTWADQFEDVNGVRVGRNAQEGGDKVKGDTVDPGRVGSSTELIELLGIREGKYTNHRTLGLRDEGVRGEG